MRNCQQSHRSLVVNVDALVNLLFPPNTPQHFCISPSSENPRVGEKSQRRDEKQESPLHTVHLIDPDLFEGVRDRHPAAERKLALKAATTALSEREIDYEMSSTVVLDLRVFHPVKIGEGRIHREWLYVVVGRNFVVTISPKYSEVVEQVLGSDEEVIELPEVSPCHLAMAIVRACSERSAATLDDLDRINSKVISKGYTSVERWIKYIPTFVQKLNYVLGRMLDEKTCFDMLRGALEEQGEGALGVKKVAATIAQLNARELELETAIRRGERIQKALNVGVATARLQVEDRSRKAQEAELLAQKNANALASIMTIIAGIAVPLGSALAGIQAYALSGWGAHTVLAAGVVGSGALMLFRNQALRFFGFHEAVR